MKSKNHKVLKPKYKQSRLQFGNGKKTLVKCPKCDMTYSPTALDDKVTHQNYHDLYLKGRKWPSGWGITMNQDISTITPPSSSSGTLKTDRIVMVRPDKPNEVKAALELMEVVNNELNAPHDENEFWTTTDGNGKAFLYIKDGRAVGAVTMEILQPGRGRWMIYKSKRLVQSQRPSFILGISRIWVSRSNRAAGIASQLLEVGRKYTIYGEVVDKRFLAWSQPTESGGHLASKYNSVKHSSGELLIPCYI